MVADQLNTKKSPSAAGNAQPQDVDRFFHGLVLEPQKQGYLEACQVLSRDGSQVYICYYDRPGQAEMVTEDSADCGHAPCLMMKASSDRGRNWGEPWILRDRSGQKLTGYHQSLLRLPSGALGIIYSAWNVPGHHTGRDFGTSVVFRSSEDEGRSWSEPTVLGPTWSLCCTGHALVLSSGQIVAPMTKWISHEPTNEAEEFQSPTLSHSFCYVSDNEGQSWKKSLSELFVSVRRAAYDLEEPTVVELKDGRLLMHLRSQLGRMYRTYSDDGGISWSRPQPMPIASSYTPCYLCRIPGNDFLLMIWNQASRQEILTGLHRARLSCAISKDEGESWENYKNLESLDNTTVVPPPPTDLVEVMEQWEDDGYYQPSNIKRYHRTPGALRICYANVAFCDDEAIVVYDYGMGVLGEDVLGIKIRAIPLGWFTS